MREVSTIGLDQCLGVGLHAYIPLKLRSQPRVNWIGSTFGMERTDAQLQSHSEAPIPARSDQAVTLWR